MASKYRDAWLALKRDKKLTLVITDPRRERTIRKAIIEYKKFDDSKSPFEHIRTRRRIEDGRMYLDFELRRILDKSIGFLEAHNPKKGEIDE